MKNGYTKIGYLYDADDVNDAISLGTIYEINANSTPKNCPPSNGVTIHLLHGSWGVIQIAFHYQGAIYSRAAFNGGWSPWHTL